MTSLIDRIRAVGEHAYVEEQLELLPGDSLDTVSSSSTSSASSPQSSRSGTSSRSLRGLMKSGLVAYLPALLVGANAQIQTFLARGIFADGKNGRTTP